MCKTQSNQKHHAASCSACGATFTETHWGLHAMGGGRGPVFGDCPNGCDESTQRYAYEDYCSSHGLDYGTGKQA